MYYIKDTNNSIVEHINDEWRSWFVVGKHWSYMPLEDFDVQEELVGYRKMTIVEAAKWLLDK